MLDLINLDVHTLIGALFWVNFTSVLICGVYNITKLNGENNGMLKNVDLGKFFLCLGFLLIFFRRRIPDLISVNFGNSFILSGIYFESQALLSIVKQNTKRKMATLNILWLLSLVAFNAIEFVVRKNNIRIAVASAGVFVILLLPIACLLFSKASKAFHRFFGGIYLLFNCMLLPRIIMSFNDAKLELNTNNPIQSLTFIVLLLITVSSMTAFYIVFQEERLVAENTVATSDYLTKLLNRQAFIKKAKIQIALHSNKEHSISLALISLDNLKHLNSKYGDNFADKALKSIAGILTENLRSWDIICRFSGKEFAVLLPKCREDNIENIIKRIFDEILSIEFSEDDTQIVLSAGVTYGIPSKDCGLMDYIETAEICLKEARNGGINQIICSRAKK